MYSIEHFAKLKFCQLQTFSANGKFLLTEIQLIDSLFKKLTSNQAQLLSVAAYR